MEKIIELAEQRKKTDNENPAPGAVCGTCPQFQPNPNMEASDGTRGGECRIDPPKMVAVPGQPVPRMVANRIVGELQTVDIKTLYPMVPESAWCGKHPARATGEKLALLDMLLPKVMEFFKAVKESLRWNARPME